MRVLNVVGSLLLGGGIETALLRILRAAPRDGIEIDFCISGPSAPTLHHEFEALGCGVWACRQGRDPFGYMRRFRRALRTRPAYDVVHAHVSNFSGPVLRAARQAGVPRRIAQYHNLAVGHANDWLRRMVERWLRRMVLREATGIAAITQAGLRHWFPREHEHDPRMSVLRYGIDVAEFAAAAGERDPVRRELGVPQDAPVYGHVGRFVWQKNHATLIEAAARIAAQEPAARFLLVGDGALRGEIEQQAAALGLRERVIFTGVRR
ncbi:MAG: glycosyltransferase, partial [Phycisphaerae bacterium]